MKTINSLFTAWKKEDRDMAMISAQKYCIGLLFVLCLLFFSGWVTAPSRLIVYEPPDLSSGATLKPNTIPAPYLYSFAYQIWQEINYWSTDGETDYPNNITAYSAYLTPSFKATLLQDEETLKTSGELQRERRLQGIAGRVFDASTIKKINSTTWEIDLTMHLSEVKNNQVIKDVEIFYPLLVTRSEFSQQNNPFGLVLAGFAAEPQRLKTTI